MHTLLIVYIPLLIYVVVALNACGETDSVESSSDTATACAESDLIAQCPPNSFPDLESSATITCSLNGSIDATQEMSQVMGSAVVDTACYGRGECQIACRLLDPCDYGVSSITTDGIICNPPPLEMSCAPNTRRCDGALVQACSLRGEWDTIACPEGEACRYNMMGQAACGSSDEFSCEEACTLVFMQCISDSSWCPNPQEEQFYNECRRSCETNDDLLRAFSNGEQTCVSLADALGITPEEPPLYCQ